MEFAKLFLNDEKLEGSRNYLSWPFSIKVLLCRDKVWDEVVDNQPTAQMLAGNQRCDLARKRVKVIAILEATVKDAIIPIV